MRLASRPLLKMGAAFGLFLIECPNFKLAIPKGNDVKGIFDSRRDTGNSFFFFCGGSLLPGLAALFVDPILLCYLPSKALCVEIVFVVQVVNRGKRAGERLNASLAASLDRLCVEAMNRIPEQERQQGGRIAKPVVLLERSQMVERG